METIRTKEAIISFNHEKDLSIEFTKVDKNLQIKLNEKEVIDLIICLAAYIGKSVEANHHTN